MSLKIKRMSLKINQKNLILEKGVEVMKAEKKVTKKVIIDFQKH
jgi:hypothetical protein